MDQVEPLTGFVIVDQCHVASLSVLFRISRFNCPYLLGLATRAQRQDGLTELMHAHLGQTVFELAAPEDQNRAEPILDIKDTSFQFEYREDWHGLVTALCQDEKRNRNIAGDVLQATAGNGRKAVVISERVGHLHDLARIIGTAHGECEILTGENSDSFRAKIARRFALGKLKILMAPFKSVPSIPAKGATDLFICSPVKYQDYLAQILGAVLNGKVGHERRRPVIHDYKDKTEVLRRSLDMRVKCYQSLGAVSR
jgi:superfamily II DNA or RNA helicase